MRRNAVTAALVLVLLATGVAPVTTAAGSASARTADGDIESVVVLGDSVAAGEGARDGYVYRDRMVLPGWSTTGRVPRRVDACGRSDAAYGARVAAALGAELTNLACSGASFEQGITLDDRFDAARPDLVLVTAGANSIAFDRAYAYCVLSARGVSESEAERVVRAAGVSDALAIALELAARRAFGSAPSSTTPGCTAANPGTYLRDTVVARSAAVGDAARALARAIRARGEAIGRVPEVVFTTYADPLPETVTGFAQCPDGAGLGAEQLDYMHDLFATLNDDLRAALADAPGVRVADPDPAFVGHRWCDPDPWVHGPSIFVTDPASRAPFHPTPAGHRAIAEAVLAARNGVPGEWRGTV